MGTRINVLFGHRLSDWTCREESLKILSEALPALNVVEDYWNRQDGDRRQATQNDWIPKPPFPPPETRDYLRYSGPGSFFASINPSAVWIRTGGRWRGFLSIPELRKVHIAASRAIAKAFAAEVFYCFADTDFADGEFWGGGAVSECIAVLQKQFGDPIPLDESVDPKIAQATEHGCPGLWYWDVIPEKLPPCRRIP